MKLARASIQGRYWGNGGQAGEGAGDSSDPSPPGAGTEDLHYPETQGRIWRGLDSAEERRAGGGQGWKP